ncbi:hypothetical protein NLU66_16615 [Brachybacterium sp. NBEC-018]|uniref:hypothetical protein n=1 Tax=Brachybacterium sp. NBEC-018 TaxID=2996004 RepID=UPI002174F79D|nr:hypothetical protein [Brachybacterium sp. NBEC-018]UVY83811.1 hypothetical protein NLU66_16615 [Brachybacterium sp. NBEC-018]
MTRFQLTMTAFITVDADSEEHAIAEAQDLMRQRIASRAAELQISPDDIANAEIDVIL